MMSKKQKIEGQQIKKLFKELISQPRYKIPKPREKFNAPSEHGVYILRKGKSVLYVGRSISVKGGLRKRLRSNRFFKLSESKTYQFIVVEKDKERALLEALATGMLCPKNLGSCNKKGGQ